MHDIYAMPNFNFDQYGRSKNIDFFFQGLDADDFMDVLPNT